MNPSANFLLQDCFWSFVDAGLPADQTPLLTGVFEGHPVIDVLSARFGISLEEAQFEIEAARQEVAL